ncbi:MAG TPA: hypothetical protein VNL71_09915 [Chloroflexota bacterium]|nr:hypothetical protein [Chloroflexota bacterium]
MLEGRPLTILAKGAALAAFERRPFGTPSILPTLLERRPFRPAALWPITLERGPFAAPPAFVRLVAVAAIIAAREGPVTMLLACVKAALLGSRRLEGPPTLLAHFLTALALPTATGALVITAEPATAAATAAAEPAAARSATAGALVIATEPATAPATAPAAGKAAARSIAAGALVITAETPASLI